MRDIHRSRLLNVEQVRERLNCSRRHVYRLISDGSLPALKIGTRQGIRISENILNQFIDGCWIDI